MNEKEKLEALDKTLAFLQEKDIKEVSQTTRIAINKLEAIYQKKFDTLQRVHAMGFLQILQKEYQVDLSHWMAEYDKHFFAKSSPELDNTHTTKPQEPQTPLPSPFLDSSRVKDPAEIPTFEPEKTPKWYFILPLVALAILSVGIYTYYKTSKTFSPQTHTEIAQESPSIPTLEEAPPHASTQPPPKPTPPPTTPPATKPEIAPTPPTPTPTTQKEETSTPAPQADSIVITPKEEVWMERIDLNTHYKTQAIIKETYSFETHGHKWLIAFGHGNLSIKANGEDLDSNRDRPLRFLYTPKNGLTRISLSTYKKRSP